MSNAIELKILVILCSYYIIDYISKKNDLTAENTTLYC